MDRDISCSFQATSFKTFNTINFIFPPFLLRRNKVEWAQAVVIDHIAREFEILFCQGRRWLLSCWMCLDSVTENLTEQKRVRSNVVGHGGHRVRAGFARGRNPEGMEETGSRSQPSPYSSGIRRLSGESGWRQLQWDADRKTPCVVTVAPEILLDETDGRRLSPRLFSELLRDLSLRVISSRDVSDGTVSAK